MERRKVLEKFQDRAWRERAEANIEKYRKGDLRLTVTDGEGRPIPHASVKITQVKHEFRFGANLFMLDEMETEEKNALYRRYFADVFNMATLPFYWNTVEPERGKTRYHKGCAPWYRRPAIDLCMEYCDEHGIEPREHALAYERTFPDWLQGADVETVKRELERRYGEIADRYKDKIRTIEVTNEMDWGEGKTAFYDAPDYVEWCFKTAERYFPHNQLVINEWTEGAWTDVCRPTAKYYAYTQAAMLKGARVDAIGMQYHMFFTREMEADKGRALYDPVQLNRRMDLYTQLCPHLQVTEITVPAYSEEAEDEAIQAELLENLYTLWFSHPSMEQIVYWNLVDGYAYVPDPTPEAISRTRGNMEAGENVYYGGLLRFDMTPKPAYYTLKKLICETWHTEHRAEADAAGSLSFRGFYGEYRAEITANGKTVALPLTLSSHGPQEIALTIEA